MYDLGPYFCDNPHHALLHYVLGGRRANPFVPDQPMINYDGKGMALEFGVGEGHSLRCIAQHLPVVGYDSFQGLPEDWRPGFEAGKFHCDPPQHLPPNADVVVGLFEDALPEFDPGKLTWEVRLLHIDCDLYSSTKTVLDRCRRLFRPGLIVLFDEFWGYPEAEEHEQRAWYEFNEENDISWEVLGHGVQQYAVRIV